MGTLLTLKNSKGLTVILDTFGAAIFDITLTDQNGIHPLTVHPADQMDFEKSDAYYGKTIGRNAGRIYHGDFKLADKSYHVEAKTHDGLHGGIEGIPYKEFTYHKRTDSDGEAIVFNYTSPNGESGFPGNLQLVVTYKLYQDENKLELVLEAESDQTTIANFTNHVYFNLNGQGSIVHHRLLIRASHYGVVDHTLYPTAIAPVTPTMDFRIGKEIGQDLNDSAIVSVAGGYDHPFVIDNFGSLEQPVVSLWGDQSHIHLNIFSDLPALVFYSGNYPSPEVMNITDKLGRYEALALECQIFPNAMNQPFDQKLTGVLPAHQIYRHRIIYQIETKK